jgi:hypothetical protein
MKHCTVSMIGKDHETHELEVMASSLFNAVAQAMQKWAMFWWYSGDSVVEVKAGEKYWRVHLKRVQRWRQENVHRT